MAVAAGQDVRASDIPGDVRARLRRSANQSLPNNSETAIQWDTEDEDTDDFITATDDAITIPEDGFYAIAATALYASAPGAGRNVIDIIPVSAISDYPSRFRNSLANTESAVAIGVTIPLLEDDTFTVELFQTSGAAINVTAWLSVVKVGTL